MMHRVIERIDPLPDRPEPEVEVTARDIMGDQYGDAYTFKVRGEDNVRRIYVEAKMPL